MGPTSWGSETGAGSQGRAQGSLSGRRLLFLEFASLWFFCVLLENGASSPHVQTSRGW